jgi:hypothetical protein
VSIPDGLISVTDGTGDVGGYRRDRNQRPTIRAQVINRDLRAIDDAEIIGPKQAFVLFQRRIQQLGVDRNARAVHPGVDTAKAGDRSVGGGAELAMIADIGGGVISRAAGRNDGFRNFTQSRSVARDQHHLRPPLRCRPRGDEADSRTRAGD